MIPNKIVVCASDLVELGRSVSGLIPLMPRAGDGARHMMEEVEEER